MKEEITQVKKIRKSGSEKVGLSFLSELPHGQLI